MKKIYKIEGMSCHSCEKILENNIKTVKGIKKVSASFPARSINVEYNEKILDKIQFINSIEKNGYTIKEENDNKFYIGIIFLLLFGYLILNKIGAFNFIPEIDQTMSYGLLFIVGILTSTHCLAMCGGINVSVCASSDNKNKFKPGLLYNLGRVTSYTIIGGIVGSLGSVIGISASVSNMISIIAGIFMIILGLKMFGIFKKINLKIPISKNMKKKINEKKIKSNSPYLIGILNGFLPCGPLQTMQIYALGTGSFISGAISMFSFSVGTLPLMLSVSFISGFLTGKKSVRFKKIGALLIILLGILMFNRGFNFNSLFKFNIESLKNKGVEFSIINEQYQEVVTRFERGRYKPFAIQKNIPVKWIIKIEPGDINGCNNEIIIEEYNIRKKLEIGENIIEFLPTNTGTIKYYCWMYMLSEKIYIFDDIMNIQ